MLSSDYNVGPPSLDVARDAVNGEPAITVTDSVSPDDLTLRRLKKQSLLGLSMIYGIRHSITMG